MFWFKIIFLFSSNFSIFTKQEFFWKLRFALMKNVISLMFIFISLFNYGQKSSILKEQELGFKKAQKFLKSNQIELAVEVFLYTYKLDIKSKYGQLALVKFDSITQYQVIRKNIGKWVLFESGSNWGFTPEANVSKRKILVITEHEFQFYEEDIATKENKLITTEKIALTTKKDISGSFNDFVFKDKSLWGFYFDEKRNILRQINTGEESTEGRTEIVCGNSEFNYRKYE
ncbi:hypothetical protein [Flavobacterium denitrificans]|uniref:hypothetical protein n=1 Tax=Flavobacterium denitrificans TaxID=281361 RepID=UPI00041A0164|nr:hypothetical protein [Flavobacterium denitrificans]